MPTSRTSVYQPGSPAARTRARLAAAHRHGRTDEIPQLERELQVDHAVERITQAAATLPPPPLTDEQADRLEERLAAFFAKLRAARERRLAESSAGEVA